jgi:RHS repeat-associated protein
LPSLIENAQSGVGFPPYLPTRLWSGVSRSTAIPCFSFNARKYLTSGNVTKDYCALGENRAGTNYFYTKDHLGSIRELTDDSGNIQAQYSYDPYGQPTKLQGSLDCDFQYAGYFYEATSGFNLTRYRAYSSSLGRWISRDPIMERVGTNLYAYVDNNPINDVDTLGLYSLPAPPITTPQPTLPAPTEPGPNLNGLNGFNNTILASLLFQNAKNLLKELELVEDYAELSVCQAAALDCMTKCKLGFDTDLKNKRCYKSAKKEYQRCMEDCYMTYKDCIKDSTTEDIPWWLKWINRNNLKK